MSLAASQLPEYEEAVVVIINIVSYDIFGIVLRVHN